MPTGPDKLQIVILGQILVEVHQWGGIVHHGHVDGMGIVEKPGKCHLFGGKTSTGLEAFFQKQYLQAGLGKIRGHGQTVGTGSDDYTVVFFRHMEPPRWDGRCSQYLTYCGRAGPPGISANSAQLEQPCFTRTAYS